jgi:hypothetical protein
MSRALTIVSSGGRDMGRFDHMVSLEEVRRIKKVCLSTYALHRRVCSLSSRLTQTLNGERR